MASASVALITAGSAGLGAAAAKVFAKNGFNVIINYSDNVERAQKLVEELRQISGANVFPIQADLGSRDDIVPTGRRSSRSDGSIKYCLPQWRVDTISKHY